MATSTNPPTDQEAYLVAREGGSWCEIYKLTPANKMTVGRDPASLIVLSDDKCSRRHAEIELSGEGWLIEDLNSRNGTKINGARITQRVGLAQGDVIGIGSLELLFTYNLAQPLDESNDNKTSEETLGTKSLTESMGGESLGSEILERKAQTRYVTESSLDVGDQDNGVREAIAILYRLVVKMVRATDVTEVSVMALDGLLKAISVDLGAVLLFPNDVQDRSDPTTLRIIAFRAPENTPYHKVSLRLSRTALLEKQAILGIDVNKEASGFQTLSDMQAQSVICAPIRHDDRIMGLVHLYSLHASTVLGANALEFSLAVAD